MAKLKGFFKDFIKKESLFLDKNVLQSKYQPDEIDHRDEQINYIASILAPMLRMEKPSNLFVYGQTGSGKTLSVKLVCKDIEEVALEQNIPVKIIYLNCKLKRVADTEYRLIATLANNFGKKVPVTGLPTDEVYNIFYKVLDSKKQLVILILDEIDQLVRKAGDEIIYNLTRINSELSLAQISIIGISNDMMFSEHLDPRVKSSLSEEELLFPPYNALQIQDILRKRSKKAFKEGVLKPGVIEKCAAFAAREHGDARRALELLRVAGELAERDNLLFVNIEQIDLAESKIEKDRLIDIVKSQPKQFQAIIYSIFIIKEKNKSKKKMQTGDIYDYYSELCNRVFLRPLTQRRVSDVISELDMLGIINAKVVSKGRYGRTREISMVIPSSLKDKVKKILETSLGLKSTDND